MAKLGSGSVKALNGVHPKLILLMSTAICDTPIDFTIIEGLRTTKRQQDIYAQGRTKPGNIVTYADGIKKKSNHQMKSDGFGHAIDFCPYINGKLDWNNHNNFKIITDHLKSIAKRLGINITCGIDWKKPYDPPHVQLA